MPITTCIFDAYGTLFDVNAAAREVSTEPGREDFAQIWPQIARDWRLKQLQYTWLRALGDAHTDFWQVTQDGLDYALEAAGLNEAGLRARLLALYWELAAFDEVRTMLCALKDAGMQTGILSNGAPDMLKSAVDSAKIGDVLDAVLSVEDVGVFKPHKSVYDLVGKRFDCKPGEVLFVSANGWDAAAASGYGFYSVWVNRNNEPIDRLPWQPHKVLSTLTGIPDLAKAKP